MLRQSIEDETVDGRDLEMYGIDFQGPVPDVQQEVEVPDMLCPLNESNKQLFLDALSQVGEEECHDYGLSQFNDAKQMLSGMLE